jgi:CRISPR/Cas system-associated exonuclease Cas4 (RecB family)
MLESIKLYLLKALDQTLDLDSEVILLTILVVIIVIMYDTFHLVFARKSKKTGIQKFATTQSLEGSKTAPVKDYISDLQGLAGRPDAVIIENGIAIPVERKPLSRKIRDRHVAQLLVYLRLVEEFHGERPPYGYLILGKSARRVKIMNTPEKQAWLQKLLDEMRGILNGEAAKPLPTKEKCAKCDVRAHCKAVFNPNSQIVQIKKTADAKS